MKTHCWSALKRTELLTRYERRTGWCRVEKEIEDTKATMRRS